MTIHVCVFIYFLIYVSDGVYLVLIYVFIHSFIFWGCCVPVGVEGLSRPLPATRGGGRGWVVDSQPVCRKATYPTPMHTHIHT